MSKDTTERLVKHKVYKVGMTVRLRNGGADKVAVDCGNGTYPLCGEVIHSGWTYGGRYYAGRTSVNDIIGEVVTTPAAAVATKAKRKTPIVKVRTEIRCIYSDGTVNTDGHIDCYESALVKENALDQRSKVDAYNRDALEHGWEVV